MKGERGFSLVEMMVAIGITGVISGVLGVVVQQTVTVPERGNDQVAAIHSLQNATHWVSLDGQTARTAVGGASLTLTLPDNSTIEYVLYGDELRRIYGSSNRTIAREISDADFSVNGRVITMELTAAPEGRLGVSENMTCQVNMRPSA